VYTVAVGADHPEIIDSVNKVLRRIDTSYRDRGIGARELLNQAHASLRRVRELRQAASY
jgi:hypothetical protein